VSINFWFQNYLCKRRLRVRIPTRPLNFFSLLNPSSCSMVLGLIQSLTEMSTKDLRERSKARPARKADNLTPSLSWLSR
jgi:hypothetical protein